MPYSVREIGDDEWVIRGIPAQGLNEQTGEPSSFSFKSNELSTSVLSVDSIRLLLGLQKIEFVHLAALSVGYCRSIGLTVENTPMEDDDNAPDDPEHVSIYIPKAGRSSKANRLREHAVCVAVASDAKAEDLHEQLCAAIQLVGQVDG